MLKKYAFSFFSQGIVSLFIFVVNVLMIRLLEPVDYAFFALIFVVLFGLEAVRNALINSPLGVHIPAFNRRAPQAVMEVVFTSINSIILVFVCTGVFAFALVILDISQHRMLTALGTAFFVTAWMFRTYVKDFLFAHLRSGVVAATDLVFLAIACLAYPAMRNAGGEFTLPVAYMFLGVGALLSAATALRLSRTPLRVTLRFRVLRRYRVPWLDARWALAGVVGTTIWTQAHAPIVTSVVGPEAFAALAAGAVLFGPLRVLMAGWGAISKPYLAKAVSRRDIGAVNRINRLSFGTLLAAMSVFLAALYALWSHVDTLLYHGKYDDMGPIVAMWTIVAVLAACRGIFSIPLQSMRAFKTLAYISAVSAAISLLSVSALVAVASFEYSILGIALAEIVALGCLFYFYNHAVARVTSEAAAQILASRPAPPHGVSGHRTC